MGKIVFPGCHGWDVFFKTIGGKAETTDKENSPFPHLQQILPWTLVVNSNKRRVQFHNAGISDEFLGHTGRRHKKICLELVLLFASKTPKKP
jgi:hypothetical protein